MMQSGIIFICLQPGLTSLLENFGVTLEANSQALGYPHHLLARLLSPNYLLHPLFRQITLKSDIGMKRHTAKLKSRYMGTRTGLCKTRRRVATQESLQRVQMTTWHQNRFRG